jgi:hypothetical protein
VVRNVEATGALKQTDALNVKPHPWVSLSLEKILATNLSREWGGGGQQDKDEESRNFLILMLTAHR